MSLQVLKTKLIMRHCALNDPVTRTLQNSEKLLKSKQKRGGGMVCVCVCVFGGIVDVHGRRCSVSLSQWVNCLFRMILTSRWHFELFFFTPKMQIKKVILSLITSALRYYIRKKSYHLVEKQEIKLNVQYSTF